MPSISYAADRESLFQPGNRPTVFAAGVKYSPPQLCVEFARLAYKNFDLAPADKVAIEGALALVGFQGAEFFSNGGTQAFAAVNPATSTLIVAFRGTEPHADDIFTDVDFPLQARAGYEGEVHSGFADGLALVWEQIEAWVAANHGDQAMQCIFTGHSLGAALATLAVARAKSANLFGNSAQSYALITFGSPRAGNQKFADSLIGIDIQRYMDCCDLVCHLPPEHLIYAYVHVADVIYIDRDGIRDTRASAGSIERDKWIARAEYLEQHAFKNGTVPVRDLADHAPINYVRALIP
jgi:hypothetical protein